MITFYNHSIQFWELLLFWKQAFLVFLWVTKRRSLVHNIDQWPTKQVMQAVSWLCRDMQLCNWFERHHHCSIERFRLKRLTAFYIIMIQEYIYHSCLTFKSTASKVMTANRAAFLWLGGKQALLPCWTTMQLIPRQLRRPWAEELKGSFTSNWAPRVFKRLLPL